MTTTEKRIKLETEIEKAVYRLFNECKEHMFDYTMIYLNKVNSDVDRMVAQRLLEIAKGGLEDGINSKIDYVFKRKIDESLTEFTEQETPLVQPGKHKRKPEAD